MIHSRDSDVWLTLRENKFTSCPMYGHYATCLATHRHICPIRSFNDRRHIRQMLSFPDDRVVGITPILGRPTRRRHISGRQLLIFTTYGESGSRQKLYFTLEELGFMLPMREVTVFDFANVSAARSPFHFA